MWWHLKPDHPRPPGCQTAATLARSNSRGKGRGCLLKGMNKCLPRPLYQPKQAAAFRRFLLSCGAREGEPFQGRPEKNVLDCVWKKKPVISWRRMIDLNGRMRRVLSLYHHSTSFSVYLSAERTQWESINSTQTVVIVRACHWPESTSVKSIIFSRSSCLLLFLAYDKPWCKKRS